MKTTNRLLLLIVCCALTCVSIPAATVHVWQDSPSPVAPFTNWATAAHAIQDAVDAAQAGDSVLVTNGVYATGGRAVYGLMTNRVAVDKPITLASVNGPVFTVIEGYQVVLQVIEPDNIHSEFTGTHGYSVMGTSDGDGAIRCVYLANGAVLRGFTLTNGATRTASADTSQLGGGGVWCESVNALVTNCILSANKAFYGGGAFSGTLKNCKLTGNSARSGGGVYQSILNRCMIEGSWADVGGGATDSTLNGCKLTGNAAKVGAGAFDCALNNCTLTGNSAGQGGGSCYGTLNNCTLTGNSASDGGGAYGGTLNNCILYFNVTGGNYHGGTLNNCCTTPAPRNLIGNITNEPAFVNPADGDFQLRYGSPCIDAGTNLSGSIADDLDGHPRPLDGDGDGIAAFDIGAYECVPLARYVWQNSPNPASPHTNWDSAAHTIQDAVDAASAGDLVLVTNGVYVTGGRAVHGTMNNRVAVGKAVVLRSVNGPDFTVIQGRQVPGPTNGVGAVRCVYLTNGAVLAGFTLTNGATETLGDYPYVNQSGGGVLCESSNAVVLDCVLTGNSASGYGGGSFSGTLSNCTLSGNSTTSIYGWGGGACFGTLNNCTLTNNSTRYGGGGAAFGMLSNCTLTGNSSRGGGGAHDCTLDNCTLTGNSARYGGGGAAYGTLNNCTLKGNASGSTGGGACCGTLNNCIVTGNFAFSGGGGSVHGTLNNCTLTDNFAYFICGGAAYGTLNNCIVYFNRTEVDEDQNYTESTLNYCCTTPLPLKGVGNMTIAPMFVDTNGWSNQGLQSNSPCINAGHNFHVTTASDFDGNPRIVSGTADIGAYEYQGTGSVISYAWLQQYGLPTDGTADLADADSDGLNTSQEWVADTNPTNAASYLHLTINSSNPAVAVTFASSAARLYTLLSCTSLTPSSVWTPVPEQIDVPGNGDVLTLTDTNTLPTVFYRVSVRF